MKLLVDRIPLRRATTEGELAHTFYFLCERPLTLQGVILPPEYEALAFVSNVRVGRRLLSVRRRTRPTEVTRPVPTRYDVIDVPEVQFGERAEVYIARYPGKPAPESIGILYASVALCESCDR